jgi:hypothetical protein
MIPSAVFDVSPGDTVEISVKALYSTYASFTFDDVTTHQTFQTGLVAPQGVSLKGNSAEFVVETPEWISGNSVLQPLLTDFVGSPVVFQNASATYASGGNASLSNALSISVWSNDVPGSSGWVEEAYGSIQPSADTVTVSEGSYWRTVGA